jgi:hypothetical protein
VQNTFVRFLSSEQVMVTFAMEDARTKQVSLSPEEEAELAAGH